MAQSWVETLAETGFRISPDSPAQRGGRPDPAEMVARYGADVPVLDWRERLVCSRRGSPQTDMVLNGQRQ